MPKAAERKLFAAFVCLYFLFIETNVYFYSINEYLYITFFAMKDKDKRLSIIESIISSNNIGNQDELLIILKKNGVITTQATLSRDLKTLKVAKQPDSNGVYIYVLPEKKTEKKNGSMLNNFFDSGVLSVEFSGNILVIKTYPGFANALAFAIDKQGFKEIAGTIAGDDTVFAVKRENISNRQLLDSLSRLIQGVDNKLLDS